MNALRQTFQRRISRNQQNFKDRRHYTDLEQVVNVFFCFRHGYTRNRRHGLSVALENLSSDQTDYERGNA